MRSRIRIFPVLVMLFVIAACGLIALQSLDGDIAVLEDTVREREITLRGVQNEQSALEEEINNKDDSNYIIEKARGLGYLMPGEIRFVVINPEVLYDVPVAQVVGEYTGDEVP